MGYNCCFFLNFVPLHLESPYNFGGTGPILGVKKILQRVNGHAADNSIYPLSIWPLAYIWSIIVDFFLLPITNAGHKTMIGYCKFHKLCRFVSNCVMFRIVLNICYYYCILSGKYYHWSCFYFLWILICWFFVCLSVAMVLG